MKKLLLALLPTIINRVLRARRAKQNRSRQGRNRNRF